LLAEIETRKGGRCSRVGGRINFSMPTTGFDNLTSTRVHEQLGCNQQARWSAMPTAGADVEPGGSTRPWQVFASRCPDL